MATYSLVCLSAALFTFWTLADTGTTERWMAAFAVHPSQWAAVGELTRGQILRLIAQLASALFVHADGIHLIGNLIFLLVFGASAEKLLGGWRLLALFLVCGMVANLVGVLVFPANAPAIIGSSGAVSALVGAYATLFPRSRLGLMLPLGAFLEFVRMPAYALIGLWLLVQGLMYVLARDSAMIAWPVHLAGFVLGMIYAVFSRNAIARRLRN